MKNIKYKAFNTVTGKFTKFSWIKSKSEWKGVDEKTGDHCILLMYSGMKDENRKEIYEGDILYYEEPEFESGMVRNAVVFQDGAFFVGDILLNFVLESKIVGNVFKKL